MRSVLGLYGFTEFVALEILDAIVRLLPDDDCSQFLAHHPNAKIRSTR